MKQQKNFEPTTYNVLKHLLVHIAGACFVFEPTTYNVLKPKLCLEHYKSCLIEPTTYNVLKLRGSGSKPCLKYLNQRHIMYWNAYNKSSLMSEKYLNQRHIMYWNLSVIDEIARVKVEPTTYNVLKHI